MADDMTLERLSPTVGEVVYVLAPEKYVVVPARVIEKIIRETAKGTTTTYVLDFGEDGRRNVPSTQIDSCVVVATADEARRCLEEFAHKYVARAIDEAVKKAHSRFGVGGQILENAQIVDDGVKNDKS